MKEYFIVAILIFGGVAGTFFLPQNFGPEKEMIFRIEKGQGSEEISLNLEKEGLIWWGPPFRLFVFVTGRASKLQAGSYFLSPSMSIYQIATKFASGDIAKVKITIPEGFTAAEIHEKLQNVTRSDLTALEKYQGYLFPDTYEIPYGMEQDQILEMMKENFDKKTAGLKITPEIIIMASILEKELKSKEDKELASGILWKRLKVGIPLQVDAYMWTYENLRLPSKPISNPGLESIEAAVYTKDSDYWYYLSTPDGKTIFSRTLEEHNYAKFKYLK